MRLKHLKHFGALRFKMSQKKIILVTGATGMVGRALCQRLESGGHVLRTVSRSRGDFHWNVERGTIDPEAFEGVDSVVHLAGEPISQRWDADTKQRIVDSRVLSTRLLVDHILRNELKTEVICASGISYYGNHPGPGQTEDSALGEGFLASVCEAWEAELKPLIAAGNRAVWMRIGVVLSADGGALKKLLPPFKAGVGGRIGSGAQHMSWISLPDLVEALCFAVENTRIQGPVNAVAPKPATNREFTKAVGKVLKRPTLFPIPATVISALFGEMALETILSDVGAYPRVLEAAGFEWQTPEIQQALQQAIHS